VIEIWDLRLEIAIFIVKDFRFCMWDLIRDKPTTVPVADTRADVKNTYVACGRLTNGCRSQRRAQCRCLCTLHMLAN